MTKAVWPRVLSRGRRMRTAEARRFASRRAEKRSYWSETARRPIPPGGRPEGEGGPAGDAPEAEFRRD